MSKKYKDYHIGIDYGTSNSCTGIFMNSTVQIVPNRIGERITPSIVCFNGKDILVGEETLKQKIDNFKNTIYEVKRFIGLSYEEFIDLGFDKYLNYEVVNQGGIPKIKVNVGGEDKYYSAIEISSFIIKKMVQCAEDFIAQSDEGIKIKKAIITVPAHFRDDQREAVRVAAKMAGIEVPRIINEPTAAAIAYGLGHDLITKNSSTSSKQYTGLYTSIRKQGTDLEDAPPLAIQKFKSKISENAIIIDLGGGTLDITLLNLRKDNEGNINFDVEASDGDTHLGGSDFDNILIDFCIKEFCRTTGFKEENIKQDKKSCKRLKIKCESVKKLLSITKETVINIDNFFGNCDLEIKITRNKFNDLCQEIYNRIESLIVDLLNEIGKEPAEIDEIILVGGATRMPGIKDLMKRIFREDAVKDNLNPDEAVAFGATMEAAKIEEKDKINFNLQDIIPFKLGIGSYNRDLNDRKINGDLMYPIIKKNSKIPSSGDRPFKANLAPPNQKITIRIYEGNDKYVNKNTFLGDMVVDNINKIGIIDYRIKFNVDVNSQLKVEITIDSLGIKKEKIIEKVTHGFLSLENKKIRICKSKDLKPFGSIIDSLRESEQKLSESCDNSNKCVNLNNCCECIEAMIKNYMTFIKDNESVYEKVYSNTKELFGYYIQRIKLNSKNENIPEIISKITNHFQNLINTVAYIEDLLDNFSELKDINELRNIFYEIFINFMDLMNKEGFKRKEAETQKNKRYYSKLYFEREFYAFKKYIKEDDIANMEREIKLKLDYQVNINKAELKKVNSFTSLIEQRIETGKFMYGGGSGNTVIAKKLEKFEKVNDRDLIQMNVDEVREILDIFENMLDSFDEKENSFGEAYCLAHIIFINYKFFKRGYDKLWKYVNRLKSFLYGLNGNIPGNNWVKESNALISEIESQKNKSLYESNF